MIKDMEPMDYFLDVYSGLMNWRRSEFHLINSYWKIENEFH